MAYIYKKSFRNILSDNGRSIFLHLVCWLLFIAYEIGFVYYSLKKFGDPFNYFVYYALNISLFYTHLSVLNRTFITGKVFWANGLLLFAAQLGVYMGLKSAVDMSTAPGALNLSEKWHYARNFQAVTLFRGIYFCVFSTFYWVAGSVANYRRKNAEAEKRQLILLNEKAAIEQKLAVVNNAFLQQQINPHFLLNALNFIYSSVYQYSPEGSRCVLLLADLMRYSLESSESNGNMPLAGEIGQVKNLIEVNRYRYNGEIYLETIYEGDFERFQFIPLILLTLTENLFKHGNVSDPKHPAVLTYRLNDNAQLEFFCSNRKKSRRGMKIVKKSFGLENSRLRLDYAYPGGYLLDIKETPDHFELRLTVDL